MSKNRRSVSTAPVKAFIEKLSHDGRGIARIQGKITFVQGALPGETVMLQYLRQKSDFNEGVTLEVLDPSLHRKAPLCKHAALCGGCSLQHLDAASQIIEKQVFFQDLLSRIGHVEPEVLLPPLAADAWHYRNKARLSVRFVEKKGTTLIGFREKNNPRYITEIEHCPILHAKVDAEISHLRQLISAFSNPNSIAQIEVAAGDDEVALILRNLTPLMPSDEEKICSFAHRSQFRIFLQPQGPDSVYLFYPKDDREWLTYRLPQESLEFCFHPTDFTQVNSKLNQLMVKRALELLTPQSEDIILDLFCGLGNFSLPIAKYCKRVIGVEGSLQMTGRASLNAEKNGLKNTEFLALNLDAEGILTRFSKAGVSKVLLDPPRVGALTVVKEIDCISPKCIVYVSCNPATLARDANILVNEQGYKLAAAGVMDMFPHTSHLESIALFTK